MKRQLLHTPEGVRDIYNSECAKKMILQERLQQVFRHCGYHTIQTPSFEFFDIFGKEIGTTPSNELYKFFDREGNTLVLRPDITPSIARAVAKFFMDEKMPIRLCYAGNTFINGNRYQGRLKETTQVGAELINDDSAEADAEMLSMAVECLKTSGLKNFQLSIGHAEFFQGLCEAAGLSEEEEDQLRNLINNKNAFGVEEFVNSLKLDQELSELFQLLNGFYDSAREIQAAKEKAVKYPKVLGALEHLEELDQVLKCYEIDRYITFEPGLLSNYGYYTGIVFSGYTFGSGEPILNGGRYDKLLSHFGKQSPSVGFAVVVDQLMAALSRQQIEIEIRQETQLVLYSKENLRNAVIFVRQMREQGMAAELMRKTKDQTMEDYEAYAKRNHIAKIIDMDGVR